MVYLNHQVERSRASRSTWTARAARSVRPARRSPSSTSVSTPPRPAAPSRTPCSRRTGRSGRSAATRSCSCTWRRTGPSAQVISIPRDSWVPIPGHGDNKINAAFSYGGPELLAGRSRTSPAPTSTTWWCWTSPASRRPARSFDGVPVRLTQPEVWTARATRPGSSTSRATAALAYVRQRYDLPRGDFDRVQRQQNFLRGFLDRLGEIGPGDPSELTRLTDQLARSGRGGRRPDHRDDPVAGLEPARPPGRADPLLHRPQQRHRDGRSVQHRQARRSGDAVALVRDDHEGSPSRTGEAATSWEELPARDAVR